MDILELRIIFERFVEQSFSARFQRLTLRHGPRPRTHTRARGTFRGRAGGIKRVCDAQEMNKIKAYERVTFLAILH